MIGILRQYLFFILFVSSFITSCNYDIAENPAAEEIVEAPAPLIEYGIVVDSLKVIRGNIKRNEFLADILLRYGVDYSTIDYIARHTKDTFDVRKIRRGNNYAIICTNDSASNALYYAYEISASS